MVMSHDHDVRHGGPKIRHRSFEKRFGPGTSNMGAVLDTLARYPTAELSLEACAQYPGWENCWKAAEITARVSYIPIF